MVGDVLAQEMLLAGRRSRHLIFRRIYAGWLILLLLVEYWIYLLQANVLGHQMFGSRVDSRATSEFAASFMEQLVWQQFVLMLLATPAFVAGAITDEKTRGTLQYLLASDLSSLDIVLGKLLGRVWQVVLLLLPAVPMLCFIGVFAGLNLGLILALIILTAAPLLAMGAAGLLASVWCRNTRDAVLSVYVGVLVVAGIFWATGIRPLLDPRYILEPAWGASGDWNLVAQRVFAAVAIWVALAAVCLALATWQLRPVYLRQLA